MNRILLLNRNSFGDYGQGQTIHILICSKTEDAVALSSSFKMEKRSGNLTGDVSGGHG